MARSRTAFVSGTITDNPLTAGAVTLNSAGLANLPAIASPDIAVLVLDPTGSAGAPEVVYVTAHTGAATSATITRGREGSSAREHAATVAWVHSPTTYDFYKEFGSNIASATTLTLPNDDHENAFLLTGTTTVEGISTRPEGSVIHLTIDSGPVAFAYNTGTLPILFPVVGGSNNLIAYDNEVLSFLSNGSGWYLIGRTGPARGWTPVARNTSEVTTTSTTPTDLLTLSGLSIPVTSWVRISGNFRKTSGAATSCAFGLKINSTTVSDSLWSTGTDDENQNGSFLILIPPRATNYLNAITGYYSRYGGTSLAVNDGVGGVATNMPNATITSLTIRADSATSITLGVKDVLVEVLD